MGLLDGILGEIAGSVLGRGKQQSGGSDPLSALLKNLTSGGGAQAGGLLAMAMALVQQMGGLEAVLSKAREHGLGQLVDSWVGTGANASISPEQIQKVFGGQNLRNVAGQFGLSAETVTSQLAQVLPELVNQLTPKGHAEEGVDQMLAQGLEMLRSFKA